MPPNGLDAMQKKRDTRTTRKDQILPPKRSNPGTQNTGSDEPTEVYTRYTAIPLDQLAHNPNNARASYTEDSIDEMAASLAEFGQLQPVVVVSQPVWLTLRPDDVESVGSADYVVSIGNRRLAAAHKAGLPDLQAWIRDELGSGKTDRFDEAMIIENSHREDLDPLLEAKALDRMTKKPGGSLRTVAKAIGRSHGYVQQRLALLGLIPELRGALGTLDHDTGKALLGFREARVLGELDAETQRRAWLAGPPYAPPAQEPATTPEVEGSEDTSAGDEDEAAVNRVYTKSARRRVMLPDGDPSKLASILRERIPADELAELVRILLAPEEHEQTAQDA